MIKICSECGDEISKCNFCGKELKGSIYCILLDTGGSFHFCSRRCYILWLISYCWDWVEHAEVEEE